MLIGRYDLWERVVSACRCGERGSGARSMVQCTHPNIIMIYFMLCAVLFGTGNNPFLTMIWASGLFVVNLI